MLGYVLSAQNTKTKDTIVKQFGMVIKQTRAQIPALLFISHKFQEITCLSSHAESNRRKSRCPIYCPPVLHIPYLMY